MNRLHIRRIALIAVALAAVFAAGALGAYMEGTQESFAQKCWTRARDARTEQINGAVPGINETASAVQAAWTAAAQQTAAPQPAAVEIRWNGDEVPEQIPFGEQEFSVEVRYEGLSREEADAAIQPYLERLQVFGGPEGGEESLLSLELVTAMPEKTAGNENRGEPPADSNVNYDSANEVTPQAFTPAFTLPVPAPGSGGIDETSEQPPVVFTYKCIMEVTPEAACHIRVVEKTDGGETEKTSASFASFRGIAFDAYEGLLNRDALQGGLVLSGQAQPGQLIDLELTCSGKPDFSAKAQACTDEAGKWQSRPISIQKLDGCAEGQLTVSASYSAYPALSAVSTLAIPVDTLAPEPAGIELVQEAGALRPAAITNETIYTENDSDLPLELRVTGETGAQVELSCRFREGEQALTGEAVQLVPEDADGEAATFSIPDSAAGFDVILTDEAGNSASRTFEIAWLETPVATIEGVSGSETAPAPGEAVVLGPNNLETGALAVSEDVQGEWKVDDGEAAPLDFENAEAGVKRAALSGLDLAQGEKLTVALWHDCDGVRLAEGEQTWDLDFVGPEITSVSVGADGLTGIWNEENKTIYFIKDIQMTLQLDAHAEDGAVYYRTVDGAESGISQPYSGKLFESDAFFTLVARDALGNTGEPVVLKTAPVKGIAIDNERRNLLWGGSLELAGTAQPGWEIAFRVVLHGTTKVLLKPDAFESDGNGEWKASFSAAEVYKALLDANAARSTESNLVIEASYAQGSLSPVVADFTFDRSVNLAVDALNEYDDAVSGRAAPMCVVRVVDAGSGELFETVAAADGSFSVDLERHVAAEQAFDVTAGFLSEGEGTDWLVKETAQVVAEKSSDAGITVKGIPDMANGESLTITAIPNKPGDIELIVDGESLDKRQNVSATEAIDFEIPGLADGEHSIVVRYADGYYEEAASRTTVVVDTARPVITVDPEILDTADTLTVGVSEKAGVTAQLLDADGAELDALTAEAAEAGSVPFALEDWLADEAAASLRITAVDAAGNAAEPVDVAIRRTPQRVGMLICPEPDGALDSTKAYDITGWVIDANGSEPKATLDFGGQSFDLELVRDDDALNAQKEKAGPYMRLGENAACWKFSRRVDISDDAFSTGQVEVKLLADDQPLDAPAWEGDAPAPEWRIERTSEARTRQIVMVAIFGVLAIAGLLLLFIVSRRLGRLKDASIDNLSRKSRLTIRKRR